MHSELSEEIYNRGSASRKRKAQNEWCNYIGENLSDKSHDFHIEKLSKVFMHLEKY